MGHDGLDGVRSAAGRSVLGVLTAPALRNRPTRSLQVLAALPHHHSDRRQRVHPFELSEQALGHIAIGVVIHGHTHLFDQVWHLSQAGTAPCWGPRRPLPRTTRPLHHPRQGQESRPGFAQPVIRQKCSISAGTARTFRRRSAVTHRRFAASLRAASRMWSSALRQSRL